jgi:hypothetical protein
MMVMYKKQENEVFARLAVLDENKMFIFGTRKPLVRNVVCRAVAIYLIVGKYE